MSKLYSLMNEINGKIEELIDEEFRLVKPQDVGLESRAGYTLFINEDFIAVTKSNRNALDYYGGFEYVGEENVTVLGGYVFYSADDERVQGHLDEFFHPERVDSN
jgi:hypothetical protein